jgi:Domain of unknown function DUF29
MSATLTDPELYERDFHLWTQRQAAELRRAAGAGSNLPLDWANLAEEIESLGARDRREVASRIEQIVLHLLKLQHSPADEPRRGWQETVGRERSEIEEVLAQSPSLHQEVVPALARRWPAARRRAAQALADEVDPATLPATCPYTAAQILDSDWWPERAAP